MHATIAATLVAVVSVAAFAATQMGNIVSPPVTGITTLVKPALARPDLAGSSALTPTDKRSIETLVRAELRALIALDAERAFSNLTPSTQSFFGGTRAISSGDCRQGSANTSDAILRVSRGRAVCEPHRAAGADHR
jgi:hypothetical protein